MAAASLAARGLALAAAALVPDAPDACTVAATWHLDAMAGGLTAAWSEAGAAVGGLGCASFALGGGGLGVDELGQAIRAEEAGRVDGEVCSTVTPGAAPPPPRGRGSQPGVGAAGGGTAACELVSGWATAKSSSSGSCETSGAGAWALGRTFTPVLAKRSTATLRWDGMASSAFAVSTAASAAVASAFAAAQLASPLAARVLPTPTAAAAAAAAAACAAAVPGGGAGVDDADGAAAGSSPNLWRRELTLCST
mmetsp:Transcript_140544/g.365684  ORF Transcript_140544/g.365684 Transcript_140544/m.365684 type:complete len:252 (+) Transcript_140544:2175-2930(+)